MIVNRLSLHHARSYELATYDLDGTVTLILGRNGTGKTSLLEAVYLLLRGTSFRGRDRDIISHGHDTTDLKLELDNQVRRVRLTRAAGDKIGKSFSIDDKESARLPAKYRVPVVLFEPDELRLLTSSPQRRRQFVDDVLSRLYPSYATTLSRYNRTLLQRNELLKQHERMDSQSWDSHLFVWDVKFAELSETIIRHRMDFLALSNERLSGIYSNMADASHRVEVAYSDQTPVDQYRHMVLKKLSYHRHNDAIRGFTTVGPHRDDIVLYLDGHPASETASRGEIRTIMLAYKLLEVSLQEETTGLRPIILMDDVFSELDTTRERHLMRSLKDYQTIITATDLRDELKINASIITLP